MSDDKKVIFSMSGVNKTYQSTNKQVLKNIHLSFFYGAKIGILGLNGSGKSSLLKIIAGVEKNYQGDIHFLPGYSVGFLEQEPILDEEKTVLEIVKEGVSETVSVLEEYNRINDMFGLEEVLATELKNLGAQDVETGVRNVSFGPSKLRFISLSSVPVCFNAEITSPSVHPAERIPPCWHIS